MASFNPHLPSQKGRLGAAFDEGSQRKVMSRMTTLSQKEEATRISEKAARVRLRMAENFQKYHARWTLKERDRLAKLPQRMRQKLKPVGAIADWIDPKRLFHIAASRVSMRHITRMKQVDDIENRMLRRISQLPERPHDRRRTR